MTGGTPPLPGVHALGFWVAVALLSPLLLLQALWTVLRTPRLPEAGGLRSGQAWPDDPSRDAPATGEDEVFQLLIVGESTAVGVGVEHLEDALAACLARALAERLGTPVVWSVRGRNGARMGDIERLLAAGPGVPRATLALVPMGVNDSVKLSSLRAWRDALEAVSAGLLDAGVQRVAFASVPPVGWFTALPRPLRWLLGWRAAQLDRVMLEWADGRDDAVHYLPIRFPPLPELLAEDGYHPGAEGYRRWALLLADQLEASGLLGRKG